MTCTPSDERLKNNVTAITGSLQKLRDINYYTFKFKDMEVLHSYDRGSVRSGVVAQEIIPIYNSAVMPSSLPIDGSSESYLQVNYTKFVPLMLNALRELNNKVKTLSSTLNE
jgi:hypothetical protein